jgi:hypothetical protein
MNNSNRGLQRSALVMKILGWAILAFGALGFVYAPGVWWGMLPQGFPVIVPHPESPYQGLHPYIYMILVLYLAWSILMIRGARDPTANAALFDYGILANLFHGVLMLVQAFIVPNEIAHLWTDVPFLLAVSLVLWIYHPNRVAPETLRVPSVPTTNSPLKLSETERRAMKLGHR